MKKLLLHWLIIAGSLALVDYLLDGVRFRSYVALAIGALVLGAVNAVVRPILTLLTLPVTIVTLGLFYFVVNGIAFALAAFLVPGFQVSGLTTAIIAALITSVSSTLLETLVGA
jgi:putative membrane protein